MAAKEGWVGIGEVAAHLRVARESIYRWIDSKGLPAYRAGRLLRFKLSEVDDWVQIRGGGDSGRGRTMARTGLKGLGQGSRSGLKNRKR